MSAHLNIVANQFCVDVEFISLFLTITTIILQEIFSLSFIHSFVSVVSSIRIIYYAIPVFSNIDGVWEHPFRLIDLKGCCPFRQREWYIAERIPELDRELLNVQAQNFETVHDNTGNDTVLRQPFQKKVTIESSKIMRQNRISTVSRLKNEIAHLNQNIFINIDWIS